jgi:hypothetical protein
MQKQQAIPNEYIHQYKDIHYQLGYWQGKCGTLQLQLQHANETIAALKAQLKEIEQHVS